MLRKGYRIPFDIHPSLSQVPISLPSYTPNSTKGVALRGEVIALLAKGGNGDRSSLSRV